MKKNHPEDEVNKTIAKIVIKYLATRFDGKKTYIGASGKILTGIATIFAGIVGLIGYAYPEYQVADDIDIEVSLGALAAGAAMISSGIEGIGKRHAIEKASRGPVSEGAGGQQNVPPADTLG